MGELSGTMTGMVSRHHPRKTLPLWVVSECGAWFLRMGTASIVSFKAHVDVLSHPASRRKAIGMNTPEHLVTAYGSRL